MVLLSLPVWKPWLLENTGSAFPAHFLSGLKKMISGKVRHDKERCFESPRNANFCSFPHPSSSHILNLGTRWARLGFYLCWHIRPSRPSCDIGTILILFLQMGRSRDAEQFIPPNAGGTVEASI